MADCLDCTEKLSLSDILRLLAVCDDNGNVVAIRTKTVAYTDDCTECGEFLSLEDFIRKSLWCDDDGVMYLQITVA